MPAIFSRREYHATVPSQEYLEETRVAFILGVTGAFSCAALVVVLLRLYVRTCMLHFVGPDDWAMILASLMAIGTFICMCGESAYGMGHHLEWMQPYMFEPYFEWLFAHSLLVMLGVILVKISIAFFLMRIMVQKRWTIFLWISVGFLTCFAVACAGTLLFQCTPIAAGWSFRLRISPSSHCMSNRTYTFIGLGNSIINIVTDILFTVIPIPVVLKIKVNKRTKATLIAVLSLGFFACVAGIIKAHAQVTAMGTPDAAFENSFQIWYMLELCLGILAASLPTLKPLFAAVLDGTRTRLGTRSRSRATAGVLTHNSKLVPSGPTTFPEPSDGIRLGHYKKGSGSTSTTLVQRSSDNTELADVDAVKAPYNVRVTGGMVAEDGDQWDSVEPVRCGSQDRLHHPRSGIFKKVELTYTTENLRQGGLEDVFVRCHALNKPYDSRSTISK